MDWFRHDLYAQQDMKVKKLIHRYGYEGYGLYWHLVELLYQHDGAIKSDDIDEEFGFLKKEGFLNNLVDVGLFRIEEDGYVTCDRIQEELKMKEDSFKKRSEAGKKGNEKRWQGNGNADDISSQCDNNAIANKSQCDNNVIAEQSQNVAHNITLHNITKENINNSNCSEVSSKFELSSCEEEKQEQSKELPFISLPTNKNGENYDVLPSYISSLQELYPNVNIEQEFRSMKGWLNTHPKKTKKGMPAFINGWLDRSQNKSSRSYQQEDDGKAHLKSTICNDPAVFQEMKDKIARGESLF